MSKMGQKFEDNLNSAKYDLYKACKNALIFINVTFDVLDIDDSNKLLTSCKNDLEIAIAKVEEL